VRAARGRKAASTAVVSALFAAALCAGLAESYTTFCLPGWPNAVGTYRDNSTSFPASAGGVTAVRNAIQSSANEWTSRGGSRFRWSYGGPTTQRSNNLSDDVTAIFSVDQNPGNALAVTACSGNGIRGADITCFNVGFRTNGQDVDLEAVVTHEMGHALGLGHSQVNGATMTAFYFGVPQRTIEADDMAGIRAVYGTGAPPAPTITALEPASGPQRGGNIVSVFGTNLDTGVSVSIGGVRCDVAAQVSGSEIRVIAPPSLTLGAMDVAASNSGGSATLAGGYAYETNPFEIRVLSIDARAGGEATFEISGPANGEWAFVQSDGGGPWEPVPGVVVSVGPKPPFRLRVRWSFGPGTYPNLDPYGLTQVTAYIYPDMPALSRIHFQGFIKIGRNVYATNAQSFTVFP
jgi:hypothetical protein